MLSNERELLWQRQITAIAKTPGYFAHVFLQKIGTTDLHKIADYLGYRPTESERAFLAFEIASSVAEFDTAAAIEARRRLDPGTLTDLLSDAPVKSKPNDHKASENDHDNNKNDTTGDRLGVL